MTVSAKTESLGVIDTVNQTAQRLFGLTSRDLVGRNISTLIPEPIASLHQVRTALSGVPPNSTAPHSLSLACFLCFSATWRRTFRRATKSC